MSTLIKEIVQLGKTKYIQGNYYSKKNDGNYPYKSSYELAYLHQLESDPEVLQYIYEPFELYYTDVNEKRRVLKINGKLEKVKLVEKAEIAMGKENPDTGY